MVTCVQRKTRNFDRRRWYMHELYNQHKEYKLSQEPFLHCCVSNAEALYSNEVVTV